MESMTAVLCSDTKVLKLDVKLFRLRLKTVTRTRAFVSRFEMPAKASKLVADIRRLETVYCTHLLLSLRSTKRIFSQVHDGSCCNSSMRCSLAQQQQGFTYENAGIFRGVPTARQTGRSITYWKGEVGKLKLSSTKRAATRAENYLLSGKRIPGRKRGVVCSCPLRTPE